MNEPLLTKQFHDIMTNYRLNFEEQVQEVLKMGLEAFHLDIGILSKVEGSTYTVVQCVVPEDIELSNDQTFEFANTYCYFTLNAKETVAIEHVAKDDRLGNHPAYQAFGLESYIGIPIKANDKVYGTINFSSPKPFPRMFNERDIDFMERIAEWIGMRITQISQS